MLIELSLRIRFCTTCLRLMARENETVHMMCYVLNQSSQKRIEYYEAETPGAANVCKGRLWDGLPGEETWYGHDHTFASWTLEMWVWGKEDRGYEFMSCLLTVVGEQRRQDLYGVKCRLCLRDFTSLRGSVYSGLLCPSLQEALEQPNLCTTTFHHHCSSDLPESGTILFAG